MKIPLIIGHRGAAGYELEHTMPSFEKALACRADGIECDVQMTKDRRLVVFHDNYARRLLGMPCRIENLTLREIQNYDLLDNVKGRKGLKVPTFSDYIQIIKQHSSDSYKPKFFVELKFEGDAPENKIKRVVEAVMEEVAKHDIEERTVYLSFHHGSIYEIRRQNPAAKSLTGVLFGGLPYMQGKIIFMAIDAGANYIMPSHETVNKELVNEAHSKKLGVSVWIVDEPYDIRRMLEIGVDAITTNYPKTAIKLIKRIQKEDSDRKRAKNEAAEVRRIYEELILKRPKHPSR